MKIRKILPIIWIVSLLVSLNLASASAAGTVYYVKSNGVGNCSTWANACDLHTAINTAVSGDEIWVAAGIYIPAQRTSPSDPRSTTFSLKNGVAIYGGFSGTETTLEQRDWENNITVLSGDIDGDDIKNSHGITVHTADIVGTNAYHVIYNSSVANTAILDGFTVTAGQSDGSYPHNAGGGMLNQYGSSPVIRNVKFWGNFSKGGGAALNSGGTPSFTNVAFYNNTATYYGGGVSIYDGGSVNLINVIFSGNSAQTGGGLYCDDSIATIINATFINNTATQDGGGVANYFYSNTQIANSIFWNNSAATGGPQIYNANNATLSVLYSDIQGSGGSGSGWDSTIGIDGGGNIDADPQFVNPTNNDLHLNSGSPAIDAGDNSIVPVEIVTDIEGNTRFWDHPDVADTGNGTPPIVDMGAYEYIFASLVSNYSSGAPGSYFTINGGGFPANETATIYVNGNELGTVPTDASGEFAFLFSTSNADEGIYMITVSVNPSATTQLVLDSNEPLRPQDGSGTIIDIPAGIVFTNQIFLPLLRR